GGANAHVAIRQPDPAPADRPGEDADAGNGAAAEAAAQSDRIIRNHMIASMVAVLIPAPVLDVAAITGVQIKMLHDIAHAYGVPFQREAGRSIVVSLIGSIGASSVARGTFGSLVKLIPMVGPLAGAVTLPGLAGATTYAIGKIFIQHFEAGGTFLDFDPKTARARFRQRFKEGEDVARTMKPEAEAAAESTAAPGTGD
ncbi:MAG: YcjF family protein, partial [Planctomycetota bacterium]